VWGADRGGTKGYNWGVIFSIFAALVALANILWFGSFGPATADSFLWISIFNGLIALLLALAGFRKYQFRRTVPNPSIGKPPIWTLGRAFTFVTIIGALGSILLPLARIIGW